jgi:hypothetical protein
MPAVTTTATPSPAAENETSDLLQRLVVAEEALHSGHFTAAVDLGGGTRSETEMRFDLGTPARIHVWSTYTSSSGAQETENIMIGAEQWQRVDGGNWSALASVEPALAILQKYLPHASTATDSEFLKAGTLQWHDQADKSDVTVTVDTATGVPRHMERQFRSSGLSLGVTFTGWNTPVNIVAPE